MENETGVAITVTFRPLPRTVGLLLGALALLLAAQSLLVEYLIENVLGEAANPWVVATLDLFSVNTELTIPTWYATLLLFGAAALLALIARARWLACATDWRSWAGLALIFLYLSMDEGAAIHEVAADWLQTSYGLTGFLAFGWQIIAAPLLLLFALVYVRFFWRLPAPTRWRFALAGALYVGGAFFVEGISAARWDAVGGVHFTYLAIATVEETCEMLGAVVFITALLDYIAQQGYRYELMIERDVGRSFRPSRRAVAVGGALLIAFNIALVGWALSQAPVGSADLAAEAARPSLYEALAVEGIVAARFAGRFAPDNLIALRAAAALREQFAEVMVITLIPTETSIALAGDALPFDRAALTELLHSYGEVQFIVFEPGAVEALTTALLAR